MKWREKVVDEDEVENAEEEKEEEEKEEEKKEEKEEPGCQVKTRTPLRMWGKTSLKRRR